LHGRQLLNRLLVHLRVLLHLLHPAVDLLDALLDLEGVGGRIEDGELSLSWLWRKYQQAKKHADEYLVRE
jgi:hypothetical protein